MYINCRQRAAVLARLIVYNVHQLIDLFQLFYIC